MSDVGIDYRMDLPPQVLNSKGFVSK